MTTARELSVPTKADKLRLFSRINYGARGGCWLWTHETGRLGYGRFYYQRRTALAHRVMFSVFIGDPGPTLDHICSVRPCVNPYHLRRCTQRQNCVEFSRLSPASINARKTHCLRDHPFTERNTYTKRGGGRQCRACNKNYSR